MRGTASRHVTSHHIWPRAASCHVTSHHAWCSVRSRHVSPSAASRHVASRHAQRSVTSRHIASRPEDPATQRQRRRRRPERTSGGRCCYVTAERDTRVTAQYKVSAFHCLQVHTECRVAVIHKSMRRFSNQVRSCLQWTPIARLSRFHIGAVDVKVQQNFDMNVKNLTWCKIVGFKNGPIV